MSVEIDQIKLVELVFNSYLGQDGSINKTLDNKIAIYSIYNEEKKLQYIGYSRNLLLSLKQHLVRQPQECYWYKYYEIQRPSRSILEDIKNQWLTENGDIPVGNGEKESQWNQPIDAKLTMTEEDKQIYQNSDELGKIKVLKKISRRVEEEIKQQLNQRQINFEVRFNPKLKEQGLLDLKS
ncbi:MAG: GIY-YIG nuclease family protein [Cyanobacterium sp. T60_A2020_053]|nr:GIY-YIG nuclease family protein [Cyanobacterium sp. T60_A2020_053]